MTKKMIACTIDFDVWLNARTSDLNISNMLNETLKEYMELETDNKDEAEIKEEIEITETLRKQNTIKLTILKEKLAQTEQLKRQMQKDKDEKQREMFNDIMHNNPARHIV